MTIRLGEPRVELADTDARDCGGREFSVRVERPRLQAADLARLAREAATDIDRGHPVDGLRRLVAIGGLAKAMADRIAVGR